MTEDYRVITSLAAEGVYFEQAKYEAAERKKKKPKKEGAGNTNTGSDNKKESNTGNDDDNPQDKNKVCLNELSQLGWQLTKVCDDKTLLKDIDPQCDPNSRYAIRNNDSIYNGMYGFAAGAFVNEEKKEVIVAYRGSDDLSDWSRSNFAMLLSKAPRQLLEASRFYSAVKNKYKDYKVIITGHSLGGALAMIVGASSNETTYTYNPAGISTLLKSILRSIGITIDPNKEYPNIKNYVVENDILRQGCKTRGMRNLGTTYIIENEKRGTIKAHSNHELLRYGAVREEMPKTTNDFLFNKIKDLIPTPKTLFHNKLPFNKLKDLIPIPKTLFHNNPIINFIDNYENSPMGQLQAMIDKGFILNDVYDVIQEFSNQESKMLKGMLSDINRINEEEIKRKEFEDFKTYYEAEREWLMEHDENFARQRKCEELFKGLAIALRNASQNRGIIGRNELG